MPNVVDKLIYELRLMDNELISLRQERKDLLAKVLEQANLLENKSPAVLACPYCGGRIQEVKPDENSKDS